MPKQALTTLILLLVTLLNLTPAQTNISTVISNKQRATLEQLVILAEENNIDIQKAKLALNQANHILEPLGRLKEALTITGSSSLSGDYYGQLSPSYSISLALNVLDLFPEDASKERTLTLQETRASLRLDILDKYLTYLTALEQAKARALELEASELAFRAEQARFNVGNATLVEQARAQTNVSQAALTLLTANTSIITATEALAATLGLSIEELNQILKEQGLE